MTPLPNYFLADLDPAHPVTARVVAEACQSLRANRERFLVGRSTTSLIRVLCEVAEQWLQPDYPFRVRALQDGPAETGFSVETLREGLDGFFAQITPENLTALIIQDLGSVQRLDAFAQTSTEIQERRSAWAQGPALLGHVAAGNLPNPSLASLVLGILARSAQFMKCARGASLLPRLFAHSLYDADPKLASCIELAAWPGGTPELDAALFAECDCLTATGGDATLSAIRQALPERVRFLGYGHRVSFAYITAEALAGVGFRKLVAKAAADVSTWDQQGCLSPHVIFVELRGAVSPEGFAELLAAELQRREEAVPRAKLSVEEAADIASRRAFYEVRAAHSGDTRLWSSPGSTAWTVVYENDPMFQLSCLNRFIHVRASTGLDEVLRQAESVRGRVSTVGLAASVEQGASLAQQFARWGVTRICPLGRMQSPPLTWRHDGRPALADLVQWTDWEQ